MACHSLALNLVPPYITMYGIVPKLELSDRFIATL